MLPSENFKDVYVIASNVRKEHGGFASLETYKHLQDPEWILSNINSLPKADIALLAEYNRNVREYIVKSLKNIHPYEKLHSI